MFKKIISACIVSSILFSLLPSKIEADSSDFSGDEFSQVFLNTDLSKTIEMHPYSLYEQDPITLKWVMKQSTADTSQGTISYVSEAEPTKNTSLSNEVKVGRDENGQYETFIKFGDGLPSLNGALFISATLSLKVMNSEVCTSCGLYSNKEFSIHKIQKDWSANDVTWENKPTIENDSITNTTLPMQVGGSTYNWDVSKLVLDWYEHPDANYGLALKTALAADGSSVHTFVKATDNRALMPVLKIRYSPKPRFGNIANRGTLGANSKKVRVDLNWYQVTGAKGYRLYLFNGKDFEMIYDGPSTNWKSIDRKVWPTAEQIVSGDFSLHTDGSGTDLSDTPGYLYEKQGDKEHQENTYYFKVTAYNEYGESRPTEILPVIMPDATAPTIPDGISATDELFSNFSLSWNPSTDRRSLKYNVKLTTETGSTVYVGSTQTNSIVIPESYLSPRATYKVSVKAVEDLGDNYSSYSNPVTVTARKKFDAQLIRLSSPPQVQEAGSSPYVQYVFKNIGTEPWSQSAGFLLKTDTYVNELDDKDLINTGDTKTFDFRLPADLPIGTSIMKWRMFNVNDGYFGDYASTPINIEDRTSPQITLISPVDNQLISGTVLLKGSINDFQLKTYSVSFGVGESPSKWITIKSGIGSNVDFGEWDTTKLLNGAYKLKVDAEDETGNNTSFERIVNVKNLVPTPVPHEITDQSTTVTGSAKPGTNVVLYKNGTILGNGIVSEKGIFSITIPKQTAGTEIKIMSMDGSEASKQVIIKVKDVTPPKPPSVNKVYNNVSYLAGKTEKYALVSVTIGSKIYNSKADINGNYKITIPVQNIGGKINVTAKDLSGNLSAKTTVIVLRAAPNIPIVNAVRYTSTTVTGKAEKYALVIVKIGTHSYSAKSNSNGDFKVSIPKQKKGTKLTITAKDTKAKSSAPRSITVY
ncbi:DNRLRE domain-containing protein [Arthrobacter citreus]|nr:DNRLRE domain-containing protein [Arthrobacter citreus]